MNFARYIKFTIVFGLYFLAECVNAIVECANVILKMKNDQK